MNINRQLQFHGNAGMTGDGLFNAVVPNVANAYRRSKIRLTMFSILLLVSLVTTILCVVFMFITGDPAAGWERHHEIFGSGPRSPNTTFIPFVIIGAATFVTSIVFTSILGVRVARLHTLNTLVIEIVSQQKASIDFLSIRQGFNPISNVAVVRIINRLIETGNLQDYEVIGEVGVAHTSLHARPSDFNVVNTPPTLGARVGAAINAFTNPNKQQQPTQPPAPEQPRSNRCSGCGSAITKKSGRFCEFCGIRLD